MKAFFRLCTGPSVYEQDVPVGRDAETPSLEDGDFILMMDSSCYLENRTEIPVGKFEFSHASLSVSPNAERFNGAMIGSLAMVSNAQLIVQKRGNWGRYD